MRFLWSHLLWLLLIVPLLIGGYGMYMMLTRGWLIVGKGHPFSDAIVYVLMALGAYFIYRWMSN